MISHNNFLLNKVQPAPLALNSLQAKSQSTIPSQDFTFQNNITYLALLQAQLLQAQQQQQQQQLQHQQQLVNYLSVYPPQYQQNQSQYNNQQINQISNPIEVLLGNDSFHQQSFNLPNKDLKMQNGQSQIACQTKDLLLNQYYQNSINDQQERQSYLLSNYQTFPNSSQNMNQSSQNSNQYSQNIQFTSTYTNLGYSNQPTSQIVNFGMDLNDFNFFPQNLAAQGFNFQNTSPPKQENKKIGISQFQVQSTNQTSQNNTSTIGNNYPSIVKKIKKNCQNCSHCLKQKDQLSLRKVSSCSSSHSSLSSSSNQSTNRIYDTLQQSQKSSKRISKQQMTSTDKQKVSRLEETRAERWSFMKKFYNKQILINRIFIDLEDSEYISQTNQVAEMIIKQESETTEENSSNTKSMEEKQDITECSASITSTSSSTENNTFSALSACQQSLTSLETASQL